MKKNLLLLAFLMVVTCIYAQNWSLTGNSSTSSKNFLGTIDNQPIILKINNATSGFSGYEDGKYNVSFGYKSLTYPLEGAGNTAIGAQAMEYGRGKENTAIGHWAMLYNDKGVCNVTVGSSAMSHSKTSYNVAIGQAALQHNAKDGNTALGYLSAVSNTTGSAITATGFKSLASNTTGCQNTANGFNALINNTTGTNNTAMGAWTLIGNTTGNHNTALGMKSLYANTTGEYNTALGVQAMEKNTTGKWNVACGSGALYSNTTGFLNTAVGTSALWFNTTGEQNVAVGEEALAGNSNGSYNTAIGTRALWSTINNPGAIAFGHGSNNTALGYEALKGITSGSANIAIGVLTSIATTTGKNNIAIGNNTLSKNTTGSDNIAIGHYSNNKTENLSNTIIIGTGTIAYADNQVRIGNNKTKSIGGNVNWSRIADSRTSTNIKENIPGLDFINTLRPITFNIDENAINKILKVQKIDSDLRNNQQSIYSGFIAQEVEEAAKSLGYTFSGIDPAINDNGLYSLRYADFVVPLVKAVQELYLQNMELKNRLSSFATMLEPIVGSLKIDELTRTSFAGLQQNYPNPFEGHTSISYVLPENSSKAELLISDNLGNTIKQIAITDSKDGTLDIQTGIPGSGIYFYSLWADGKLIDTKKMIQAK